MAFLIKDFGPELPYVEEEEEEEEEKTTSESETSESA
jgi:hypothetical protein